MESLSKNILHETNKEEKTCPLKKPSLLFSERPNYKNINLLFFDDHSLLMYTSIRSHVQ